MNHNQSLDEQQKKVLTAFRISLNSFWNPCKIIMMDKYEKKIVCLEVLRDLMEIVQEGKWTIKTLNQR